MPERASRVATLQPKTEPQPASAWLGCKLLKNCDFANLAAVRWSIDVLMRDAAVVSDRVEGVVVIVFEAPFHLLPAIGLAANGEFGVFLR